ncbi:MAG: GH3 auxin-responsive promoter family protein [Candidatus Sericytochromatia bacterium]|nr:GH3 auxin-responsive promoter family protein [Candidatus Tanganyikabacteria bacterium]
MLGRLRLGSANALAALGHAAAARRFAAALQDPAAAQQARLAEIVVANAGSAFGRAHGFGAIRTPADFQRSVPPADYDARYPWVERALHGEPGVLTSAPILMFEKTSGSAGRAKYIPYTAPLRSEFQAATGAWLFDLWRRRPGLRTGSAYWSVSPAAREPETTPGGHPVGFADDTEYFDPVTRWVLRQILAVPGDVARVADMTEVRRITIDRLVASRDLALISVWNPSFLTLLVDAIEARSGRFDASALWPRLDLISCWTDASAALFVEAVRERFPGVAIQGKGLLSTEGVVSIPLWGHPGAALALTSHFLEFEAPGAERPFLAHELEPGERYAVLLTTGGGLYRYATRDLVEVVGRVARTPLVRFAGKVDLVSDLCGEKISALHVEAVLAALLGPGTRFALLAPEVGAPPHYVLYFEGPAPPDSGALDARLRENPHYAYCRELGQLGAARVAPVLDGECKYLAGCEALGQKPGNVKPAALHRDSGWKIRFGLADSGNVS